MAFFLIGVQVLAVMGFLGYALFKIANHFTEN